VKILILNGPNLSRLDLREKNHYGDLSYSDLTKEITKKASEIGIPVIEVHLSNPLSREEFRHTSVVSGVVQGTISGFGVDSYSLALLAMQKLVK